MKKVYTLLFTVTATYASAQVGVNSTSPSATLDIVNNTSMSKILEVNNYDTSSSTNSEVLTILKNGNIGVNNATPGVNVDMIFPGTIDSDNYKSVSAGNQPTTVTGLHTYQNLSAEPSTNTSNTQALFQSNFAYTGTSKTNNVLSVDATVNNSYTATNALSASIENLYSTTNTGTLAALQANTYNGIASSTTAKTSGSLYGLQTSVNNYGTITGTGAMYGIGSTINNNSGSTANIASNIYAFSKNNGTINDYRGVWVKTNDSGAYTNSTGLYIDFGPTPLVYHAKPYSIQSVSDIPMFHQGKACFGDIDPYATSPSAQLNTTSFAVSVAGPSSSTMFLEGSNHYTLTLDDLIVTTVVLPKAATYKGRIYNILIKENDVNNPHSIKTVDGSLIFHLKDGVYVDNETSYEYVYFDPLVGIKDLRGGITYISDGSNWYVMSAATNDSKNN